MVNPLPNNKILDKFKLKAFADKKINIAKMMISLSDREKSIVGKGENAGHQHFLFLPTMFSKVFFCKIIVCLGFYAVSTIFQLFNGDSLQIHVSWTISDQYLTSPLSLHLQTSRSAIPIILSEKVKSHYNQF